MGLSAAATGSAGGDKRRSREACDPTHWMCQMDTHLIPAAVGTGKQRRMVGHCESPSPPHHSPLGPHCPTLSCSSAEHTGCVSYPHHNPNGPANRNGRELPIPKRQLQFSSPLCLNPALELLHMQPGTLESSAWLGHGILVPGNSRARYLPRHCLGPPTHSPRGTARLLWWTRPLSLPWSCLLPPETPDPLTVPPSPLTEAPPNANDIEPVMPTQPCPPGHASLGPQVQPQC